MHRGFSPLVPTIIMKRNKTYTLAIYFDEMIKKDGSMKSEGLPTQKFSVEKYYGKASIPPRGSIAPSAKRHFNSMAFRWRADGGPF